MTNQLADGCYHLTRSQLLYDLYVAFYDAARHKHKMAYVQKFEANLAENLNELCDDLLTHRYKALPSKCFIVFYPKKREVFCAAFRDRIVHHLYFRYTHQLFERTFIADSYSCIEGRGTHYGISRIRQHIRKASQNWQEKAYAMSLDIRGYFMHINREKLLKIATSTLRKMSTHRVGLSDDIATIPSGVLQIDPDREWLMAQVPQEREFLADELGLQLHMGKLHIQEIHSGVEFLGAFVKPYRDYVSNKTLERMTKKIQEIDLRNEDKAYRAIDSYIGILSHAASYHITQELIVKPLAA